MKPKIGSISGTQERHRSDRRVPLASILVTGVLLIAGAAGGVTAAAALLPQPPASQASAEDIGGEEELEIVSDDSGVEPTFAEPDFPVNEFGQTYGDWFEVAYEDIPDLVLVQTDDGKLGYVPRDVLFPPPPDSPEEAAGLPVPTGQRVDVFESDGKTRIGTMTLG